uniref:CSON006007 protein n=1 Tax=Culicoides sonorensis TaxID=179676 RepID=A0A336JZK2_CULSO
MAISTLLLIVTIISFAYYKYRKFVKWADNVPGYDDPFFTRPVIRGLFANRRQRVLMIMDIAKNYPRIYRLMYGPIPKLVIFDPELVKQVLTSTKCLKKPNFYRFFGWGAGLATAPVDTWKKHRKLLNPAFGIAALQSFIPIFDACSSEFAKTLEPHVNSIEFNLLEYSVNATLDSICATSFGINVQAQKKRQKYAMISLKIMIIHLLRKYKFNTSLKWSDIKWQLDIHLHITKPHLVSIQRRNFYDTRTEDERSRNV